jgi:ABC-type lipoprotein release transport system permease subunit
VVLHAGLPDVEVETNDVAGKNARVFGEYVKPREAREFLSVPGDIYLGDGLTEKLDARIGDRVVVTIAPPGGGDPRAAAFFVSGTFHTAVTQVDRGMAHIDLADARDLLGVGEIATQVAVLLADQEMVPRVTDELRRTLSGRTDVVVHPWQEVLVELHEALVIDEASNQILMGVIFFIVTLGIFNSILMSVTERTRELGVQKALGTSGRRIFSYVMMEAFILALVSAAVGVGLGLGVHFYMATHGLNVGAMMEGDYEFSGIAFNGYIYSRLTASGVAFWAGMTVVLVLLSALYPAYRAARQVPVEAMRHV